MSADSESIGVQFIDCGVASLDDLDNTARQLSHLFSLLLPTLASF